MGSKSNFFAASWRVGGPLLWEPAVGKHGTLVLVVGWSKYAGVDAHLNAVVVTPIACTERLLLRSMHACDLTPYSTPRVHSNNKTG